MPRGKCRPRLHPQPITTSLFTFNARWVVLPGNSNEQDLAAVPSPIPLGASAPPGAFAHFAPVPCLLRSPELGGSAHLRVLSACSALCLSLWHSPPPFTQVLLKTVTFPGRSPCSLCEPLHTSCPLPVFLSLLYFAPSFHHFLSASFICSFILLFITSYQNVSTLCLGCFSPILFTVVTPGPRAMPGTHSRRPVSMC